MPRLLEVADLCSSTVSDTANRLRKTRKKKSSAVLLFLLTQSTICTQALEGKVEVQRGRETMGVPSFLLPRRVPQSPPRTRHVPHTPQRAKSPPRSGEPFTRFGHTAKPVPATASLSSKTPFAFPRRRAIINIMVHNRGNARETADQEPTEDSCHGVHDARSYRRGIFSAGGVAARDRTAGVSAVLLLHRRGLPLYAEQSPLLRQRVRVRRSVRYRVPAVRRLLRKRAHHAEHVHFAAVRHGSVGK